MLAGGGIKPGVVVGSSTTGGDAAEACPVHIYDVLATIYRQLGVSTNDVYRDSAGRPMPILPEGLNFGADLMVKCGENEALRLDRSRRRASGFFTRASYFFLTVTVTLRTLTSLSHLT